MTAKWPGGWRQNSISPPILIGHSWSTRMVNFFTELISIHENLHKLTTEAQWQKCCENWQIISQIFSLSATFGPKISDLFDLKPSMKIWNVVINSNVIIESWFQHCTDTFEKRKHPSNFSSCALFSGLHSVQINIDL